MNDAVYHRRLAKALDRMGGLYTLNDILTLVGKGAMQSFAHNNSWAITQICIYPRAKTLNVVVMAGDIEDYEALDRKLTDFATEMGIGLITAIGRKGWRPFGEKRGWKIKSTSYVYYKEL
jgi:hypothetical protein